MSERAIRPRRGQRLAAGMAVTSLMSLGLLVTPAAAAEVTSRPELSPTPIKVAQSVKAGQRVHFDSGIANYGGSGTAGGRQSPLRAA
jgi:hypothetical protein